MAYNAEKKKLSIVGIVCEEEISITRGLGKKILTQTD